MTFLISRRFLIPVPGIRNDRQFLITSGREAEAFRIRIEGLIKKLLRNAPASLPGT